MYTLGPHPTASGKSNKIFSSFSPPSIGETSRLAVSPPDEEYVCNLLWIHLRMPFRKSPLLLWIRLYQQYFRLRANSFWLRCNWWFYGLVSLIVDVCAPLQPVRLKGTSDWVHRLKLLGMGLSIKPCWTIAVIGISMYQKNACLTPVYVKSKPISTTSINVFFTRCIIERFSAELVTLLSLIATISCSSSRKENEPQHSVDYLSHLNILALFNEPVGVLLSDISHLAVVWDLKSFGWRWIFSCSTVPCTDSGSDLDLRMFMFFFSIILCSFLLSYNLTFCDPWVRQFWVERAM